MMERTSLASWNQSVEDADEDRLTSVKNVQITHLSSSVRFRHKDHLCIVSQSDRGRRKQSCKLWQYKLFVSSRDVCRHLLDTLTRPETVLIIQFHTAAQTCESSLLINRTRYLVMIFTRIIYIQVFFLL